MFQWISYAVCTFHIFYSTGTPLWGMLYIVCRLGFFILSIFNYLVWVDAFIFILSLLWSWILVGGLIFCVSLKLLSKPWGWVLIIAVMVQLYFTDFKLIDYQLFAILYLLDYVGICYSKFYSSYPYYCSSGTVILYSPRIFQLAFMYVFLILGYVLFRLVLFLLWYCLVICCSKFYDRLCYCVGYEFFMEVLKIGLHC